MENYSNKQVLVTGGTGFLGSYCILQLLEIGYLVKTTIRNIEKKEQVLSFLKRANITNIENLTFFVTNLSFDENWSEAVSNCDFVLHTASPFPMQQPKDEDEVINPAVDGTLRVLKASELVGVKRVVLTSSFGAVGYSHTDESSLITELNWTDTNAKHITPYIKSKTFAEKAAWEFINRSQSKMELTVICPRLILGPVIGDKLSTSLRAVKKLFDGTMKASPDISYGIIDVRDLANLHIQAMTHDKAKGERFLASSGDPITFKDMALLVKKEFGEQANQVSVKVHPNWLVKLVSVVNPMARNIVHQLGKTFNSDNSKAGNLLGWIPRKREEVILDTFSSMIDEGIISN